MQTKTKNRLKMLLQKKQSSRPATMAPISRLLTMPLQKLPPSRLPKLPLPLKLLPSRPQKKLLPSRLPKPLPSRLPKPLPHSRPLKLLQCRKQILFRPIIIVKMLPL